MLRANILIAVIACANAVQLKAETKTEAETEFWNTSEWKSFVDEVGDFGDTVGDQISQTADDVGEGIVDTGEQILNFFSSFF